MTVQWNLKKNSGGIYIGNARQKLWPKYIHNDDDVLETFEKNTFILHSTEKLEESFELLRHVKSSDRSCYEGNSYLSFEKGWANSPMKSSVHLFFPISNWTLAQPSQLLNFLVILALKVA